MGRAFWFVLAILLGAFGLERAEHTLTAGSMELKPPARHNALRVLLHPPPVPPPPPPPPLATMGGAMP